MELTATTDDFGHPPHRAPVTLIEQILELLYERGVAVAILSRVLKRSPVSFTLANLAAEMEQRFTSLGEERDELKVLVEQIAAGETPTDEQIEGLERRHKELIAAGAEGAYRRFHVSRRLRAARVVRGLYSALAAGSEAIKRAERAEAEVSELVELARKGEQEIRRLKAHLALLNVSPDGRPYPNVRALPVPELPACWVTTSDGDSASVRDDTSGVGRMALEHFNDRLRVVLTYDVAGSVDGWSHTMLCRMAARLATVAQQQAPEGVIFEAPDGSPAVQLSPLVARLLADQVQAWRETLHPQEQEAQIAELLGLMKSGESFADARARIAATRASPT